LNAKACAGEAAQKVGALRRSFMSELKLRPPLNDVIFRLSRRWGLGCGLTRLRRFGSGEKLPH
jgi:hypothetical protein